MSLISDALRKARQEAAENEAGERGLDRPVVAGYWKRRRGLGGPLVLGLVIAVGAAILGGALVWWGLGVRHPRSAVVRGDEAVGAGVPVMGQQKPSEPASEQPGLGVDRVKDSAPAMTVDDGPIVKPHTGSRQESQVLGTPIPHPKTTPSTESPTLPAEKPAPGDDGVFVAKAQVGEVTLTLDYLVFRKDNPFAQINGIDVRVGSVIEDFVVEAITPESVVLRKDQITVEIRVR
jgi:hypothetical protein